MSMAKTTTRKTKTAAKRPATAATRKPPASANPAVASAVKAVVTSTATPAKKASDDDLMRKPDLIEKVVVRSGVKKKDAKPVVEAMLAVLGEALAEGQEMRLPPLGKVMVNRTKDLENGTAYIVKIRSPKKAKGEPAPWGKDPLAKAAE
ncbi:MAG: HU family DNA-binding protein [Pseudomonadota bacterium]